MYNLKIAKKGFNDPKQITQVRIKTLSSISISTVNILTWINLWQSTSALYYIIQACEGKVHGDESQQTNMLVVSLYKIYLQCAGTHVHQGKKHWNIEIPSARVW